MARRSWTHLSIAFIIAVILSFIGLRYGNFEVTVDNAGWWSRGTLISNRATQEMLINLNRQDLFYDETGDVWEELQTVIQPNWQRTSREEEEAENEVEVVDNSTLAHVCSGQWYGSRDMRKGDERNLMPIWMTEDAEDAEDKNPKMSMLDADAMYDLCMAEQNTLNALEDDDSCYKCSGKCIDPYSLVLMARLHLVGNDPS